ncbi:helix-turn-helix domain-containing protein [Streptomyces sp. NPDC051243]|uniref:helix-turn-helix domain-containing protein n=1 Tax=Streptomyces sp. NPDC051243 TaxID=3365646 RepID=UPI003789239A
MNGERSHADRLAVVVGSHRYQFAKEWMSVSGLRTAEGPATAMRPRRCIECACQLSRYNREDCCSACLRGRQVTAPASRCVPEQVWEVPEVRLALAERDFGRLCTLVRTLGGLRQDDMVTLTGLSQSFLSMLERGERRLTNIDRIVQLLAGLKVPLELTGPILRPSGPPETLETSPTGLPGSVT